MDASCPSLPPKILVRNETDAELRPNAQTTAFMAARGCHLSTGCLFVLLVIIESFFLAVRDRGVARTLLYKVSIAIVSRTFSKKPNLQTRVRVGFDNFVDRIVAFTPSIRISCKLKFFVGLEFATSKYVLATVAS